MSEPCAAPARHHAAWQGRCAVLAAASRTRPILRRLTSARRAGGPPFHAYMSASRSLQNGMRLSARKSLEVRRRHWRDAGGA